MARSCKLLLFICALVASQSQPEADSIESHGDDLQFLLEDVNHIWLSGAPGWFTVYGENSFPVVAAQTGSSSGLYRPMIAGGRYGKGRIIAAAHTSFVYTIYPPVPVDRDQLLLNAVNWLSPDQTASSIATIGANIPPEVKSIFESEGINITAVSWPDIANASFIADFDVLLVVKEVPRDSIQHVLSYLDLNRGLLLSATAWSASCCKDGERFPTGYTNNVITSKAGFVFSRFYGSTPNTPMNTYNTSVEYLKYLHYNDALLHIKEFAHGEVEADGNSVDRSFVVLSDVPRIVF